jgi:glucosylceramidase
MRQKHSNFLGIGGALTDASAETCKTAAKRQEILEQYFDPKKVLAIHWQNQYSWLISPAIVIYVSDNDAALKTFSVARDKQFQFRLLKKQSLPQAESSGCMQSVEPARRMKSNNKCSWRKIKT